tara:strand:+ start:1478 stop:1900 length:423 start_codon:yes stop_codon:yes gene_type:complete
MSNIQTPNQKIVSTSGAPIGVPKPEVDETKPTQLPDVQGYRILCMVPQVDEAYDSGLIKSDKTKTIEEHSTVVLFVMKLGDMAYKDEQRFPTGPWCKEGDFVITRAYSGTRIKIHGQEFRIINDDTVEAVVDDPRGYERA